MSNESNKIRSALLEQTKPFTLTDIVIRLEKKGLTNKGLIYKEFDDLYYAGLFEYVEVQEGLWAFRRIY